MSCCSSDRVSRAFIPLTFLLFVLCLFALPLFAVKGVFQGRVVEGTARESGKFIYVAGRTGYLRRVNIEKCRVRFGSSVSPREKVSAASEFLRQDAEVRVTAEQDGNGEWIASEILILKLPTVDKVRLLT